MAMTNEDIRAYQVKANNNILTPEDAKVLIHELNLTRNLVLDMSKAAGFIKDTTEIIFGIEKPKNT